MVREERREREGMGNEINDIILCACTKMHDESCYHSLTKCFKN